jgi:hypothetical protein
VTTLEKFQAASGIASRSVAKDVLDFLAANGIGNASKGAIEFSASGRLHAAMLALQMGCDIEQVSEHLSWRDFERLASEVLRSLGYRTQTNVQLTKPRMEIIAVDCKHWKRSSMSSIATFSRKQAARAERLFEHDGMISMAVPAILTLHSESVEFAGRVPVVLCRGSGHL